MNINPTTPMTDVRILRNVPLDSTYSDAVTFNTASQQVAYFQGKTKYSYTNMTPYREQNVLRLPIVADKLFDCNYVMFKNGNFGDKWFYAFINEITYININACQITIEVDVLQTWYFDWTFKPSFVEREHVNNDAIGANIIEENLEHGDYVYRNRVSAELGDTSRYHIIVASTENPDGTPGFGHLYSNIYSGVGYVDFKQDFGSLNGWLENLTINNKIDSVLGIFMCPEDLLNMTQPPLSQIFVAPRNTTDIDGYVPKNNKLFTYPYNFALLANGGSQTLELRYEFMSGDGYTINSNFGINLEAICYPTNYAGITNAHMYKVGIKNFPMCAFTVDSYKAWLAQNQGFQTISLASSALSTAVAGAGAVASGNPLWLGVAMGGLQGIANTLETNRVHQSAPEISRGSQTGSAEFANGIQDFFVYNACITSQYAKVIDDFFSMYGYQVNEVKLPNIVGRPSWNYVKLREPKIVGSVPFDDMAKIKSIYEKGITCWHGDWVGDYTRVNK